MAVILGITGAIGSGKTSVSHFLAQFEPKSAIYESGQIVAELANYFNQSLASELSFDIPTSDTELVNQSLIWFTETISEQLHKDVTWNQLALTRHRLAIHPEQYEKLFAYLAIVKERPELAKQVITHENKSVYRPLLQWLGGYLVATVNKAIWYDEIFRRIDIYDKDKRLIIINGLRYPADAKAVLAHSGKIIAIQRNTINEDSDITETERHKIVADSILYNNGSLEQLRKASEQLWRDASADKLQAGYGTVLNNS